LSYQVSRNSLVEMTLRGHSTVGRKMVATIVSLPAQGKLYHLSQPYSKYGGSHPKYEASTEITSPNTQVTDQLNRVIYVPPRGMAEPNGKWASFLYKVVDSKGETSYVGQVDLIPPANVLVGSDFSTNIDGWVIRSNGANAAPPAHEPSRQGPLNNFVHAQDLLIDQGAGQTSDMEPWKFCVPAKFKGNYELAYGGTLEFTLGSFSGDFSKLNDMRESVVLECKTCNLNNGMRFVQKNLAFDGKVTKFNLKLDESAAAGWLKDPNNQNTLNWQPPASACEMVEMLSSLSEICILGDHTKWYESIGLDSVTLTAGPSNSIPHQCLCTNPGTQCTTAA
jgi:hypothetical protein